MVELENRLGFVTELSETGAEAGHLLPTLVRNVDLIRVYFSEKQVHVHEGLVEFFLQHFKPPKHWHTRAETGALACRGASTRSGHVYRQRSPDVNVSLTSTLLVSDVNESPLCEGTVEITLKRNDEIPSRLGGCKSSEFPFFFFFFFWWFWWKAPPYQEVPAQRHGLYLRQLLLSDWLQARAAESRAIDAALPRFLLLLLVLMMGCKHDFEGPCRRLLYHCMEHGAIWY